VRACQEIQAFIEMASNVSENPNVKESQRIRDLPEPLQAQLTNTISSITEYRYDTGELYRAARLTDDSPEFSGGLNDAILAIKRVLIDNGAYPVNFAK
jgi:hypothetical protein